MMLREVQEKLAYSILRQRGDLPKASAEISEMFECKNQSSFSSRLEVYHNNVVGTLSIRLSDKFPMLQKFLGEDFLRQAARLFVIQNPPESGCLLDYGEKFPEFLSLMPACKSMPYLRDFAKFEYAIYHATIAEDDIPLSIESLRTKNNLSATHIALRNSVRLIQTPWDLEALAEFCRNENRVTPDITPCGENYILIWRPEDDAQSIILSPDDFKIMNAFSKGKRLKDALEEVLNNFTQFDFADFLQRHIQLKTLQNLP